MDKLTVEVKFKGINRLVWRLRIGRMLVRLAEWIVRGEIGYTIA